MEIYERPLYLDRLIKWRDRDMIKVVTGIRRAGKSTILSIFRNKLATLGVSPDQMVSVNFEDPDVPEFAGWRAAWEYLKPQLSTTGRTYVFLDEIQRVPAFEKLVDGLHARKNLDIYMTGSNAYLLSGELATYLSGRSVEIGMQPFSFSEYCAALHVTGDFARHYVAYLRNSSFPYALTLGGDPLLVGDYLDGIYNTVLVKDVFQRKRLADTGLVDRIARFLFDNIGNISSMRSIAGSLNGLGIKTNANTVDGYVEALCDAFLFRKARRYDIRGKEILSSGCKYYAADIGLRTRLCGNRVGDTGRILENIVYLELLRRHNTVLVGQHDGHEVDFVVRDGDDIRYYQVSETIRAETTRQREFAPLLSINDNYPKTLITLDEDPPLDIRGVRQVNAYAFLLGQDAYDGRNLPG